MADPADQQKGGADFAADTVKSAQVAPQGGAPAPVRTNADFAREERNMYGWGGGAALLGGVATYLLSRKIRDKRKRLALSALAGLGLGAATAAGKGVYNHFAWRNKYKGTGRLAFGYTSTGSGSFDPDSNVPIVMDAQGKPTISLLLRGIRRHTDTGTSDAMGFGGKLVPKIDQQISEQVSGSIVNSKHLGKYIDRVQRASDAWAAAHNGERPRIRLYGHSRGGGAAVALAQRLKERDPSLSVSDLVGIDPLFLPSDVRPFRNSHVADRVVVARPDRSALSRFFMSIFAGHPWQYAEGNDGRRYTELEGFGHRNGATMLYHALKQMDREDRGR